MRINASRKAALAATAASLAIFLADPALAQTQAADKDTSANEDAQSIVVIGTRRTDRTVTDSASPVDVISAQELGSQPTPNMLDAVKNLVPSFFVPQNTISDASTFVRAPSLRGLPADNILVMINGKRFNRSPLVQVYTGGDTALSFGSQGSDISSIPSIAISNLQILRDGATAQYGSDAIGGVLNYGLRKDSGFELQGLYGQHYDSYGPKTPFGNNGRTYQISGDVGVKLGDSGFINIAGEYADSRGTSRGETRASAKQFATNTPAIATQLPNYPGPVQIWGSSPNYGYKFVVNGEFDIGADLQLYFFGNLAHSKADQSFNYRLSVAQAGLSVFDGTSNSTRTDNANSAFSHPIFLTACPAANATCPTGGFVFSNLANTQQTFNFTSLYPAGFTPRFVGVNDQIFGVLGLRGGDVASIKYDASISASKQQLDLSMYGSLSPSFGPQTQTSFKFGKLIQREINANLDLSHEFDAGFASPLTLSGGLEYRKETYEATQGDLQSYAGGPYAIQNTYRETAPGVYAFNSQVTMSPAASGYGGTSPTFAGSHSQDNYGAYMGLEGDLTKRFSMGIAARYEHYNSFGDAFVTKLNGLWHINDAIALRGTVGTGFHAPSPGQNNVQILTTTFVAGDQVQVGTYPVTSNIAQYFGAKPLGPERSTNYGAGIVLTPARGLSLTIDAYSIKVRNRIGLSKSFNVTPADLAALPALAGVGVGGSVQYFTNGFDTSTKGIDIVGSYRTELAGGKLNLTAAYNYNQSKVTRFDPGVIGVTQLIDIKYLAPAHRANFAANWQMGDFQLNLREAYYGVWRDSNDYPIRAGNLAANPIIDGQHFGAKWITDLDVSYTFADHFTLTLGANNLFNTYPDRIAATIDNRIYLSTNATQNGSVYPRSGGPFGINGGFYYARIRIKY